MGPKMKEMKRFGKIAIWSLCFATLTLSCTKVEQAESAQAQISYNVVQYTQTKAAGLYPTTVPFVSSAFYLENGKTWAANRSEAKPYIENAIISYDVTRTNWRDADHSYYWPRAGKLTFFSYSPQAIKDYTQIDRNSGITITDWDVNSHKDVDIMIADVQTDQTANQNVGTCTGVPTIFRHALSKISGFTFNLHKDYANGHSSGSYANGDVVFILKSIVIKNMPQKGTYSNTMPSESNIGAWNKAADGVYSYTWYSSEPGSDGTTIPYSESTPLAIPANGLSPYSELYLLPQLYLADGGPSLEITYTKRTYSGPDTYVETQITASVSFYDLFASTWNRLVINRNLTFNIVFNIDSNLITWAPDQQPWGSGDFKIDF